MEFESPAPQSDSNFTYAISEAELNPAEANPLPNSSKQKIRLTNLKKIKEEHQKNESLSTDNSNVFNSKNIVTNDTNREIRKVKSLKLGPTVT